MSVAASRCIARVSTLRVVLRKGRDPDGSTGAIGPGRDSLLGPLVEELTRYKYKIVCKEKSMQS